MEKRQIKFGELKIGDIARKNLMECCDNNWITMGEKTELFEKKWGELFDYPYNVAVSSGTDGVLNCCLALYEYGAKIGDEIILPALSFIATANAVRAAGFTPVFCDIKKETLNIDETLIEEKITAKTVGIIAVHTMGRPCEMDIISAISKKHGLILIEDSCESHGARYKDKYVGHWGDMSCVSLFSAHILCAGEGSVISCHDEYLSMILKSTRNHGRSGEYFDFPRFGLNSKMNDLEASIALEGIEYFWKNFHKREMNVHKLRSALDKFSDMVWFSEEDEGNMNCPHGFSITLKENKDKRVPLVLRLTDVLDNAKIQWKRNFGCISTQHNAFKYLGHKLGDFPNAEHVGSNGIHVGVHQYLSSQDIDYMIDHISFGLEKCR